MRSEYLLVSLFSALYHDHRTVTSFYCLASRQYSQILRARTSTRRVRHPISVAAMATTSSQGDGDRNECVLRCGEILPSNMKGIYFSGFEQPVQEKTIRVPKVSMSSQQHVLVEVRAVSLNPVDAKHVVGDKIQYHWTTLRKIAHRLLVQNTRAGFDFAGIVAQDHPTFPKGTRVFGDMPPLGGSCAEYIAVPIHQIAKAPDTLSLEECSTLPLVGLTAWQLLSPCVIPNHSNVLVIGGSGGTGHIALQVAKGLGARQVVTVCSTPNVDFVRSCGADHVVDYRTSKDILQDLHAHGPFDVIMDCVTSADPTDSNVDYPTKIRTYPGLVTPQHLYQRLGGQSSDWIRAGLARPKIFPPAWLWRDPRERLFWIRFPHSAHELEALAKLANEGKLKPKIQKQYPELTAETVQSAFDDLLSRRVQGKIVVQV